MVARDWAQRALEERAWKFAGDAPEGESNPFYVRSGRLSGVAKPREPQPPPHRWPRAAVEKICADLAHCLDLPVPPVILWKASRKLHLPVRTLSVSLQPFDTPVARWTEIEEHPDIMDRLLPHVIKPSSALVAFDSWVGNTDRKNPGNLIFTEEDSPPFARVAYIDFAASLQFGYSDGDPLRIVPVDAYPVASQVAVQVLESTIEAIERLPRSKISEVVGRIPAEFLPEAQKKRIITGLWGRQSTLRRALVRFFEELPWAGQSETSGSPSSSSGETPRVRPRTEFH